eukprot:SAG31_NODE_27_length_32731_cov_1443.130393_21_plen_61_part_00
MQLIGDGKHSGTETSQRCFAGWSDASAAAWDVPGPAAACAGRGRGDPAEMPGAWIDKNAD